MYQVNEPQKIITQHIRKNNGAPVGLLVGVSVKIDNKDCYCIGWSKKHSKDTFNKECAFNIAYGRAIHGGGKDVAPPSILPEINKFTQRCKKYFKEHQSGFVRITLRDGFLEV